MRLRAALKAAVPALKARWPRLLAAAILLALLVGNQGFRSLVRNYRELRGLRQEVARLEKDEARLSGKLKSVRTGDAALERMARRELGFIKKGEVEYRFPPPTGDGG